MAWLEAYKVLGYELAGADDLRHRLKRATNSCAVFHAGGFALNLQFPSFNSSIALTAASRVSKN